MSKKRYLAHDRDPLLTADFLKMLGEVGIESVRAPPRSSSPAAEAIRRMVELLFSQIGQYQGGVPLFSNPRISEVECSGSRSESHFPLRLMLVTRAGHDRYFSGKSPKEIEQLVCREASRAMTW